MTKKFIKQFRASHFFNSIFLCLFITSIAFTFFNFSNVNAVTTVAQEYATNDKNLVMGSIVSLEKNSYDHVVASSNENADRIIGVVVNDGSSLITINSNQENRILIATSGNQPVLVSDINGEIHEGDQITASPIKGVGMKATANSKVIGISQADLSTISNNSQQEYTDSEGNKQKLTIGQINVQVNVAYYFKQPEKTLIPQALQNIANNMAGKNVNAMPIIISGAIFIITLIVVSMIIYSMIRNSIISVGRNPMSQSAVYRNVIQLSVLVLVIIGVALISIYTILTRF